LLLLCVAVLRSSMASTPPACPAPCHAMPATARGSCGPCCDSLRGVVAVLIAAIYREHLLLLFNCRNRASFWPIGYADNDGEKIAAHLGGCSGSLAAFWLLALLRHALAGLRPSGGLWLALLWPLEPDVIGSTSCDLFRGGNAPLFASLSDDLGGIAELEDHRVDAVEYLGLLRCRLKRL